MSEQNYNPMALAGRHILVSGASSGIGQATAIMLSRLGARVVCAGRDSERLARTVSLLEGSGHSGESFDLLNTDQIGEWLRSVGEKFGPLDGMVHAAGIQSSMPMFRIAQKQWSKLLSANLDSTVMLVRGFLHPEVYTASQGSLVFISSVLATIGSPGRSAY